MHCTELHSDESVCLEVMLYVAIVALYAANSEQRTLHLLVMATNVSRHHDSQIEVGMYIRKPECQLQVLPQSLTHI